MIDHLWIALWAVLMVAGVLSAPLTGSAPISAPGNTDRSDQSTNVVGLVTVLSAETCLLLITAALLSSRQSRTRGLGFFIVFAALTLLWGSVLDHATRGFFAHFVGLALSTLASLVIVLVSMLRSRRDGVA